MSAQTHQSDPRIFGRRTLEKDHRYLASLLHPGLSVLDVGCGTGAITAGIAKAVEPHGNAVGIDRDEELLEIARKEYITLPNLQFEAGDATTLNYRSQFDIVTAARTLQWISEPGLALLKMKAAARTRGSLVVLDYDHIHNEWQPDPPAEFRHFYQAFLSWREANRWDNEMASHLPELFQSAGLSNVESHNQDEIVDRSDQEFPYKSSLWLEVIENVGAQIAKNGFCTERQLHIARKSYSSWIETDLERQRLAMRTVTGRVVS